MNELMRTYNLITSKDDPGLNTLIINNIANDIGLISSKGKMVILRINGVKIGMYSFVEHHSKEWFEKTMQITNYALIKSNDDWDTKKMEAHMDDTDLLVEDKEIVGSAIHLPIALGALEKLMDAVKEGNYFGITNLIDVEYMAKLLALYSIVNISHPITGDNLKYVYDFTSGKFKILFRLEDNTILPISNKIEDFNESLFNSVEPYSDALTHKLFKTLLKHPDFRYLRDKALMELIDDSNKIFDEIEKIYNSNKNVLLNSNISRRRVAYEKQIFIENLKNNLFVAQKYLNYSKIYISINKDDSLQNLRIISDSYQPSILQKIQFRNIEDSSFIKRFNYKINSPKLNDSFEILYKRNKISIKDIRNIEKLFFYNPITKGLINQKNIYINYIEPVNYYDYSESIKTLVYNKINYSIIEDTIIINNGNFEIKNNLIFPNGFVIKINKGVQFNVASNRSILVRGGLIANGSKKYPIIIKRSGQKPFGTFAVISPEEKKQVLLKNFVISGGSQGLIHGIDFTGQFSIHNAEVFINNILVEKSSSDDGINIKNSNVEIINSKFINNFGDQIDLDYCEGLVLNNYFSYNLTADSLSINSNRDGIDISGSKIKFGTNKFYNFSDKAISIGESSIAYIDGNRFYNNNNAIVVKDGSVAYSPANFFENNNYDYSLFIKKSFYSDPKLYLLDKLYFSDKSSISDGEINYKSKNKMLYEFQKK